MNDEEMKEYLQSIKTVDENGCWTTKKYSSTRERKLICDQGKNVYIYRLSYALFKGPIKEGKFILHQCDNPACFNPDHLKTGTARDNMRDCVERGRKKSAKPSYKRHGIKDPYDYQAILTYVKSRIEITEKNEWLYCGNFSGDYPLIQIQKKTYLLHRLILANKLKKRYEELDIACHRLPDGIKPKKHDINPDHIFEGSLVENARETLAYRKDRILTDNDIKCIRAEIKKRKLKHGEMKKFDYEMATKFNVGNTTIQSLRLGKSHFKNEAPTAKSKGAATPIVQLSLLGKKISEFKSIADVVKKFNISYFNIKHACNNKVPHKGYYWYYESDFRKGIWEPKKLYKMSVVSFDIKGNVIEYNSIREATRALNISFAKLKKICEKKEFHKGYFWLYKTDYLKLAEQDSCE